MGAPTHASGNKCKKVCNISRMVKYALGMQEIRKGLTQVAANGVVSQLGTT